MSNTHDQWLSVTTHEREGYSHVRIRDICRIAINRSIGRDGDRYSVTIFANGTEFTYSKDQSLTDAEAGVGVLLELSTRAAAS